MHSYRRKEVICRKEELNLKVFEQKGKTMSGGVWVDRFKNKGPSSQILKSLEGYRGLTCTGKQHSSPGPSEKRFSQDSGHDRTPAFEGFLGQGVTSDPGLRVFESGKTQ